MLMVSAQLGALQKLVEKIPGIQKKLDRAHPTPLSNFFFFFF